MKITELIHSFTSKRILIVGDVMVDSYIFGNVHRISPEAPVPIVSLRSEDDRLGGAANVALNIQSLGATPILCSVIGNDKNGEVLLRLMNDNNLSTKGLVNSNNRCTTVKTRVIGNHQQLLRIDSENTHFLDDNETNSFLNNIKEIISSEKIDAIILEDYNKGVLNEKVIQEVISLANEKGIPTAVDPKLTNFLAYKNVTMFKPNLKELREGLGRIVRFEDRNSFNETIELLENELNNEISFVTLSQHGVFIKNKEESFHIPAHVRNIADVSGAGDTVISVATLCLASGASIETIAEVSNLAGGLVCEKMGVVSITSKELLEECEEKNI